MSASDDYDSGHHDGELFFGEDGEDLEDELDDKPTRRAVARVVLTDAVKPIRGKPRPQRFSTFDLETWQWEHPYLASWYGGQGEPVTFQNEPRGAPWLRGRDPGRVCVAQFLDFFLRKENAGTICYAHNGGKFDFLFLLWELGSAGFSQRGYRWRILPIQSGIFRIYVTHPSLGVRKKKLRDGRVIEVPKQSWIFSDSLRLLPMSLDKVGESFEVGRKTDLRKELGLPPIPKGATRQQKLDASAQLFDVLARPQNRAIAIKYNRLDCRILYDGLRKYEEHIRAIGGEMKGTTPSSSIDVYRRKFQRRDIFTNKHISTCGELGRIASKCRGCGHEAIRDAYSGGRSEIYTTRGVDLNYYDYNSHYLSCMAERMPVEIATVIEGGDEAQLWRSARGQGIGIIDCDVSIPEDCYLPPLPWRERSGGSAAKLLFPVGSFSGSWDTEELRLLPLVGGRITKIRRQLWFGGSTVFEDFVKAIWAYRRKGDTAALRELAKLLGNANYGKWAQRPESIEYFVDPSVQEALDRQLVPYAGLEQLGVFVGAADREASHIAPAISVHVCSIARSRLWRTNFHILQAGGRIYYSDTDSTMVSGYYQEDSKELGGMKLEHHIRRANFQRPKAYEFQCYADCPAKSCREAETDEQHTIKAKGLGRGLGAPIDYAEWERMINTTLPPKSRKVVRQRISQFKESYKAHARDGRRFPYVITQPKGIIGDYDKRTLCADGVNTVARVVKNNVLVT